MALKMSKGFLNSFEDQVLVLDVTEKDMSVSLVLTSNSLKI